MQRARALRSSLNFDAYNFPKTVEIARCQSVVRSFMELVMQDSLVGDEGRQLLDQFCKLLCHQEVWFAAETVIPQLRMTLAENQEAQQKKPGSYECLNYVLNRLAETEWLPTLTDANIATTELELLQQRFMITGQFILTNGRGVPDLNTKQLGDLAAVQACLDEHYTAVHPPHD